MPKLGVLVLYVETVQNTHKSLNMPELARPCGGWVQFGVPWKAAVKPDNYMEKQHGKQRTCAAEKSELRT